jgi:hypothetical protein
LILINAGSVDPSIRDGLHVLANLISIRDESSISSTSLSSGKGSDINLSILDRIEIESNIKNGFTTGIYSLAKGSGRGGNIDIRSGSLVMVGSDNDNPSVIRSTSDGGGSGGDILMGLRGDLLMTKDAIIGAYAIDSLKSGDIAIKVGADLKIRDRSSITSQAYSENSEGIYSYGETGGIKVAAGNILISYKDQLLSPINTGIFNFNKNESGLVGAVDVSSRGSINILGGYGFGGTADKLLGAYVGIVSISHLKYSPSAPGGIYVRAANRINMRGFGPEEPSDAPAFLRFRYPVVITGILSSLDGMSDIPPPSIHVFSGGGISLFQSGILSDGQMKNPSSLPSINLKTPGNVSLYRSEISNGIGVDSFSQAGNNAAVSVSAGNILIQDKSDVSSNVPGHGINLESSGGIHISSNTVNLNFGKDLIRRSYPDFSVFYNGFYGSGGINIKAKDNITLFNASIGAQKSTASESRSIMNISVSAENFTFIESSVGVVNPGDISDYSNSNIKFYSRGLFPLFNVVNGRFYTDDGGLNEKSAPLRPYGLNNKIFKSGSGVYSEKIAISGTLLGISGFMPTLNPPQFESNARGNACQTYKSGDLSITGKGRLGDPMGYLLH